MNPAMLEASDDLTNLSHLNEPAGLNALQQFVNPLLMAEKFSKRLNFDIFRKKSTHTAA
jgi:hypothetical protein